MYSRSQIKSSCKLSFSIVSMISITSSSLFASLNTNGLNGINSIGLGLDGRGIAIGQVEPTRPGLPSVDMPSNSNPDIVPAGVFVGNMAIIPDLDINIHSEEVAGLMISKDMIDSDDDGDYPIGVAPQAMLFSSASKSTSPDYYELNALAAQHIATKNGGDVRAINFSFGNPLVGGAKLDGNSLFTAFVDWSAKKHDVLYVVAGNEFAGGVPIPTDNFNGVTVAFTSQIGNVYRDVIPLNNFTEDAVGERTSVDLVAPGTLVEVNGFGDAEIDDTGTSIAAPFVTGTVALLQQYADERITNAPSEQWNINARRHEVMKVVLMNSTDKIEDTTANGKYLGMSKTVLKGNGDNWFQSAAYLDEDEFGTFLDTDTPLDEEMGTGQLNAKRALQQFISGEHELNGTYNTPIVGDVPLIGWDYGSISGASLPINKYLLDEPLEAGNFISITLAWDRNVDFAIDAGGGPQGDQPNMQYDVGDTFQSYTNLDSVLSDLDLYLVPAGTNDIGDFDIAISESEVSPVEHIFCRDTV